MQIAFPLFSAPFPLKAARIVSGLQKRHRVFRFAVGEEDDEVLEVKVDDASVLIAPIAAAFPAEDLRNVHPYSRRGWNGHAAPETNVSHAIATVQGAEDERQAASVLTLVMGELCMSEQCIGVLWSASGVLAHRSIVTEAARHMDTNAPAIPLWIAAVPYRDEHGLGLTTRGLTEFIGRDLHFLPSEAHQPESLFLRAMDIAEYLYENGPVLLDNQSVGYSETDILRAAWTETIPDRGGEPVRWIELRVENLDAI